MAHSDEIMIGIDQRLQNARHDAIDIAADRPTRLEQLVLEVHSMLESGAFDRSTLKQHLEKLGKEDRRASSSKLEVIRESHALQN